MRRVTRDFIRWRGARGYEITPFKREFWGKKAWHNGHESRHQTIVPPHFRALEQFEDVGDKKGQHKAEDEEGQRKRREPIHVEIPLAP